MSAAAFLQQLAAEHQAWLALLELLEQEESALVRGDGDQLAAINEPKLLRLQEITGFVQARNGLLVAAGFPPDHGGMADWIARHGKDEGEKLWQTLCDCEARARKLHERIGILLNMRMSATRQALNVLLAAANGQGSGYGQDGMAVTPSGGRALTSA